MMHVISLGAGVQSTTMALMAAHGEIEPMPNCAIFADTGWEPKAVYDHLQWLMSNNVLPFPVHIVNNGNIREMLTRKGSYNDVPFFFVSNKGRKGIGRRQCTHQFKLRPLMWKQRELLGKGRHDRIPAGECVIWIGISTDEAMRMKPASADWQQNRWPLIEKRMNRNDCLRWLEQHGYPLPPRSACIGCPYNSDARWRHLRDNAPDEWADAVTLDKIIREPGGAVRGQRFMHRSLVPLDQADLSTAEERGQLNLFNNECEGMCGV